MDGKRFHILKPDGTPMGEVSLHTRDPSRRMCPAVRTDSMSVFRPTQGKHPRLSSYKKSNSSSKTTLINQRLNDSLKIEF